MRQNVRSWQWKWFCGGVSTLLLFWGLPASMQAQAPATNLGNRVEVSVQVLQTSVQSLSPQRWKASSEEKQELAEAQQSLQRNLREAVPGLLHAWNSAPQNMSEAFRLYRDLDAVYQVASRLSATAGQYAPSGEAQAISSSTEQLKQSLQQLGDYIQATAALQYAQVQKARSAPPPPPPAPKTMVIDDANTSAPAHSTHHRTTHTTTHKKKPVKAAPAPKPASSPGGVD